MFDELLLLFNTWTVAGLCITKECLRLNEGTWLPLVLFVAWTIMVRVKERLCEGTWLPFVVCVIA